MSGDSPETYSADRTVIGMYAVPAPVDLERFFRTAYAGLRDHAAGLGEESVLVAVFDHHGNRVAVGSLDLTAAPQGLAYVVVGRHPRAHLRISRDASVALRHVIVRLLGAQNEKPEIEIRDLNTGQGFWVPGLGMMSGARSAGHLFARLGSAILMVLPKRTWPRAWPKDPKKAWKSLPSLELVSRSDVKAIPRDPAPRRPTREERTGVTMLPAARTIEVRRAPLGAGMQYGVLTLEGQGNIVRFPVTRSELEEGLLVGRYPRCQIGADLSGNNSWSRVHVFLLAEGDRLLAYDTASTAGTVVDAVHMDAAELGDRATLALGTEVRLVWERTSWNRRRRANE